MSPSLRTLMLFAPVAIAATADLSTTSTDLRLHVGLTTPFRRIEAKDVDPGAGDPRYDQRIDGTYQGGPHVGVQVIRCTMDTEGVGWFGGVELAWDMHRGQARNVDGRPGEFGGDGRMTMNALSATLMVGPAFQANLRDMGLRADAFRVEIGPTVRCGAATATLGASTSDAGLLWAVGAQVLLVTTLENDLTITVGGGYEYAQAQVRWDNTADSTAMAYGAKALAGIGYRF